ncbi:hypothetical protein T492DRAFT_1020200 [Pavlovales sp. CCMP2436]|nr:hypothetical protein T492DRAFT_1020200 [Pavlovales sp. CCMP2436]
MAWPRCARSRPSWSPPSSVRWLPSFSSPSASSRPRAPASALSCSAEQATTPSSILHSPSAPPSSELPWLRLLQLAGSQALMIALSVTESARLSSAHSSCMRTCTCRSESAAPNTSRSPSRPALLSRSARAGVSLSAVRSGADRLPARFGAQLRMFVVTMYRQYYNSNKALFMWSLLLATICLEKTVFLSVKILDHN